MRDTTYGTVLGRHPDAVEACIRKIRAGKSKLRRTSPSAWTWSYVVEGPPSCDELAPLLNRFPGLPPEVAAKRVVDAQIARARVSLKGSAGLARHVVELPGYYPPEFREAHEYFYTREAKRLQGIARDPERARLLLSISEMASEVPDAPAIVKRHVVVPRRSCRPSAFATCEGWENVSRGEEYTLQALAAARSLQEECEILLLAALREVPKVGVHPDITEGMLEALSVTRRLGPPFFGDLWPRQTTHVFPGDQLLAAVPGWSLGYDYGQHYVWNCRSFEREPLTFAEVRRAALLARKHWKGAITTYEHERMPLDEARKELDRAWAPLEARFFPGEAL